MGASCDPDYHVMGMQNGEQIVNMLRLVALCISLSVFHPWLNPSRRQHMRIFFLHWTSGVAYVLSQFIMSVMVLNCWSSRRTAGPFIYFFKFVELTAVNLWAISSISIAIVITRIVQAFSQLRRVHSVVGSVQTVWRCTALAIALSCCSAPFWNDVMVTGAYFWVTHTGNEGFSRWISLSFLTTQAVAGFLMALILIFNVTGPRRASLIVCCKTSKRVKIYFILTILGTCVYLYNGAVLFVDEFAVFRVGKKEMVMIGWCSKYIHVIADTFVLFSAFQAIDKRNVAVEDAGPRAQQSAGPSVGPSSSDHSRLTVPGPSWLCDSLPRTASGTHNNTGEIRSPASSASAGSLSSPTIPVGICDGEGNGAPSSPLPPRSAFGRLVAGVTGRSSKSAASWISGNGDSPRARGAAAVAELEQGDCDDGGGGDGDGGGGRCSQAEVQSAIASVGSCTINSHSSSNANIDSNSHASGNINSNSSNSHASSKTHASGNITTSSNINSNNSNSNSQRSNNTHNSNTNSNSSNNYSSNENTSNRRLNIFNFSETASKGSSRGDTPIGTAIGNSLNRPEISPCSLGPKAAPFSGGESSGTSSLRLTVQAGPPQREEDVESGWVGATELSTV